MKKIDLLTEKSDFIKEVLETPPNRVIRWGNTFFLFFIVLIFSLSWFIKYPDIVNADVVLTTNNPPIYLSSKTEGKIDTIFRNNNALVDEGEWLAIIGSNANLKHVQILDSLLNRIKNTNYNIEKLDDINLPILNVGEVQSNYNKLVKSVSKYLHHEEDGNYNVQLNLNNLQIKQYNALIEGAIKDVAIARKELGVAEKDLDRNKYLLDKGVIAQKEFEEVELRYFQAIRNLENIQSSIIQVKSQRVSLLKQDGNLKHGEEEIHLDSSLDILEIIKLTELSFIEWKKKHVLISSVSGQVNYLDYFTNNQFINIGDRLISVIPNYENSDYFGIVKMPITNSGKVKLDQRVNIKLLGFPFQEYGMILGRVSAISEVTNEDFYLVKVDLDNGLITSHNKKILFKQNINGLSEIITEDLRLLERFLYTLTKTIRQ